MQMPRVYELIYNGKRIMTGTVEEIAKKMGVSASTVYYWKTQGAYKRLNQVGAYRAIYEVYYEGELVIRGTVEECAKKAYLSKKSIATIAHRKKNGGICGTHGGYAIDMVGYEYREVKGDVA